MRSVASAGGLPDGRGACQMGVGWEGVGSENAEYQSREHIFESACMGVRVGSVRREERACVPACMRACVHAWLRACVPAYVWHWPQDNQWKSQRPTFRPPFQKLTCALFPDSTETPQPAQERPASKFLSAALDNTGQSLAPSQSGPHGSRERGQPTMRSVTYFTSQH